MREELAGIVRYPQAPHANRRPHVAHLWTDRTLVPDVQVPGVRIGVVEPSAVDVAEFDNLPTVCIVPEDLLPGYAIHDSPRELSCALLQLRNSLELRSVLIGNFDRVVVVRVVFFEVSRQHVVPTIG